MADADPLDDPEDTAALNRYAASLADAVDAALPVWVERVVAQRWREWRSEEPGSDVRAAAAAAGGLARAHVVPALRELLAADVDAQGSNPLALIRRAVSHATVVLSDNGVPPVQRDRDAERIFPDDVYDLSPASFADLDPSVHEPGLAWGAAKAYVILKRRRGRR
ncbi:MAG: hypothetical protein ACRDZU_17540 [Acidimicrobiales bacterium]